jgi:site-specific recombinase XerD
LAPYAPGFEAVLVERGYGPSSVRLRRWLFDHLSRWLEEEGLAVGELAPERVERFLAVRRSKGYKTWVSPRSMRLPMEYLRSVGAVPAAETGMSPGPDGELLAAYRRYLVEERGLAAATVEQYEHVARVFLLEWSGPAGLDLERLCAAEVMSFLRRECATDRCSIARAKYVVAGLRSLLRYLHVAGVTATALAPGLPGVAGRNASSLPRGLAPAQVAGLLASCDRRRGVGRRDYAILTLLVRLGLRAGEVAALQLDDLDWHRGEITIRGKGNRHERLPLPADVGQALAAYLRRGRPRDQHRASRSVFLRVKAPWGGLAASAVEAVVHDACIRAGLPLVGAHRLRHTTATQMLGQGASLPEVAQVLRHRSLATTAIYAKVDRKTLRPLARPWPGGAA